MICQCKKFKANTDSHCLRTYDYINLISIKNDASYLNALYIYNSFIRDFQSRYPKHSYKVKWII